MEKTTINEFLSCTTVYELDVLYTRYRDLFRHDSEQVNHLIFKLFMDGIKSVEYDQNITDGFSFFVKNHKDHTLQMDLL